jgi:hypothetical protein
VLSVAFGFAQALLALLANLLLLIPSLLLAFLALLLLATAASETPYQSPCTLSATPPRVS